MIFASANLARPAQIGRFNDSAVITVDGKEVEIEGFQHRF